MHLKSLVIFLHCISIYMKGSCASADRDFLQPCQEQRILKPIHVNNCTLTLANNDTKIMIKKLISDHDVKIVLINLKMPADYANGFHGRPVKLEEADTYVYQPFHWQIVRFDVGQNLLLFFLKFKLLNLTRINLGFKEIDINMPNESSDCETSSSYTGVAYGIREILSDYTQEYAGQGKYEISVCTQVIKAREGITDFRTICYTYKTKQKLSCDYLNPKDGWKNLILFRDVIVICTFLFLPFLVPSRLYNVKHNKYLYNLPEKLPVSLTISKSVLNQGDTQAFALPVLQYSNLKNSHPYINTEYQRMVNALYLDIDEADLLPRGYAGAEVLRLLYKKLYRCKCQSNQMNTCFKSTLFPLRCRRLRHFTWHDCCGWFMHLLFLLLLPSPWLLRLFIYYTYEANYITVQVEAVKSLNLTMPAIGSLLNYIPPLHWSFLFAYTLYFIDVLFFGFLYNHQMRSLGEYVKSAFRDMEAYINIEVFVFHVDYLLWPLKTLGLPGLAVAPFYWLFAIPPLVIWYIIYLIPIIRLSLILFKNMFKYCTPCIFNYFSNTKVEHLPVRHRVSICITILIFLLSLVSSCVLIAECVCYLINVCFYAVIIIILNAKITLPYVSLGVLVIFYFFETVNAVRGEYDSFQKKVTDKLIEEIADVSDDLSSLLPFQFTNIAYAAEKSMVQFVNRRGKGLICCSPSMILFVDSYQKAHIPESFFHTICNLPYAGCPGSLTVSYLRALSKYFLILIFLGFVFIVVQTFSGLYNFSSTNRMLATLVGGFVPLFIRKIIAASVAINEVDMETIAFKTHFTNAVKEFSEESIINDFRLDRPEDNPVDISGRDRLPSTADHDLFMNIKICPDTKKYKETTL